ncbi:MAG: helix-turn-helix transcriptional regulator [Acidobacteria bacterium]|nr:helix-turn-helix transcriptional regulator [Acidobacteriota bacterium]
MALKLDTEIRQEQIAQAALAVVARHGIRRLSIASVARRVGIVPSAPYRHFENKDDLRRSSAT